MRASAQLIRKAGIEDRDSQIEGKTVRVAASEWSRRGRRDIDGKTDRSNAREHMSQSASRASFNAGNPVPQFFASFFPDSQFVCELRITGQPDDRKRRSANVE